ncbi:MAG: hypothetical protein K0R14_1888 [Burkholderiales bacterium]|jgi:hypothetical protein|nr:hypothetical protein [Burkholderiales bacterium]
MLLQQLPAIREGSICVCLEKDYGNIFASLWEARWVDISLSNGSGWRSRSDCDENTLVFRSGSHGPGFSSPNEFNELTLSNLCSSATIDYQVNQVCVYYEMSSQKYKLLAWSYNKNDTDRKIYTASGVSTAIPVSSKTIGKLLPGDNTSHYEWTNGSGRYVAYTLPLNGGEWVLKRNDYTLAEHAKCRLVITPGVIDVSNYTWDDFKKLPPLF